MNKKDWNEGLNNIDPALVEEHIEEMAKIAAKGKKDRTMWIRYATVAATVCIVFGAVVMSLVLNRADEPEAIPEKTEETTEETTQEQSCDTETSEVTTKEDYDTESSEITTEEGNRDTESPSESETVGSVITDVTSENVSETESEEDTTEEQNYNTESSEVTTEIYDPIIFNAMVAPDKLEGSNQEFIKNLSSGNGGMQEEPPAFDFDIMGSFVVKARVVENLPDTYYKLDTNIRYAPTGYRLIQMEVLELIRGLGVPKYFLYLIPEYNYVDMSIYDSLLISMWQIGTENYVLKNGNQSIIEAFSLPVFADDQDSPELGNVIAFSDGFFDESLWQNRNWFYGYQFARSKLDNPEHSDLVVYRGCSEYDAVEEVKNRINKFIEYYKEKYPEKDFSGRKLLDLNFSSQEAQDAVEYVKPFANGVLSQYRSSDYSKIITFTRYINGCKTKETVTINLETEEVTYSDVRYTNEEMQNMANIAAQLSIMAQEYKTEIPIPPHTDPDGKELRSLHLYAWYTKVDGKIYGVIKTVWKYWGEQYAESVIEYYDEAYILYDMSNLSARSISREDLVEIVGWWNIDNSDFGVGNEIIID